MAHRGHIGKTLLLAEVAALCLLLPARMEAQTPVSLSNGFSTAASSMTTNMALGATWGGGQTPTNQNNAFIVFTNKNLGVNLTLTNAASNVFVADSLTITNMSRGNLAVTFSGAAFLTSGVAQVNFNGAGTTQAGTTALTFSNSLTFGAMNFIGNNGGGASQTATLTLAGASQGNNLLFNGQGSENNFLVISGTLGLTGTLTATNINSTSAGTISGNSTVGNVVINNAADNRFTITGSTMSITGAVASVAGGFTLANNATIALSGGGGLIISNVAPVINGTLNIGNQTVTGDTIWSNNGTVALAGGYIVGNNLTNASGATLVGYGNLSNVVVNLGTIWATNNTLAFASNVVQGGTMTIGSGSTLSLLGSGALTNFGTINLVGNGVGNNAVLNLGTAALTNLATGTITGGGVIQNASQVVNLGTILATNTTVELQFTNGNTVANTGTMGATAGATLTFGTAGVGSASISNAGTINLTGGTLNSGNITNVATGLVSGNGTVTAPVINSGIVSATNGNLNLVGAASGAGAYRAVAGASNATLTFAGGGSISALFNTNATIQVGGTLTNTSVFVNQGTIVLAGGTYQSAANFTNVATKVIVNSGAGTINAAGVFNLGTILVTNATVAISNLVVQNGTVTIGNSASLALLGSGALTNFGTINLVGAAGAGNNAVLNLGAVALTNLATGTITGGGIIQNASQVVNLGTILATNTSVELQFTNGNTVANTGTMGATAGATLTFGTAGVGSASISNAGTINLTGGTLNSGNITNLATGLVSGSGTVTAPVINSGIVNATNGNLNLVGAATGAGVYRAVAGTSASTLTFVNGGSISSLFNTGATIQVEGALTNTALFVNEGTIMVAGGTYQSAANLINTNGALMANSGAGTINAAAVFNLGTILATNGTFSVSNLVAQGGTVTIGAGGTLTLPGATSLTNFGTINLQGAVGNNAVLNLGGASLTNKSGGTITGGGVIQNASQVVNLLGGSILATSTGVELQFTNANTFGNAGTIGASAGATLTFGTAGVGSAIITNFGTINLTGGTLNSGNITNLASGFVGGMGTITGPLINIGNLNANGGTLTLVSTPVNNGTAIVASASALNVLTDWTNGGVLTNAATGAVSGGNLTNTGTINGSGFYNSEVVNLNRMNFGGTISNNFLQTGGSFTVLSGGSTVTGSAAINGGALDLTGNQLTAGQLVIAGTGLLTNAVAGGTVNGGVSNAATINVTATTYFKGPVTNTGAMFFQGAISNSLVNSGSFNLNGGNGTITGSAANNGTINVAASTLTVNPAWANSGTILIAVGGTVAGGNLTNNSGATVSGAGTIAPLLVNNGLLTVTNGTLTLTVAPQQNGLVNVADGGAAGTLSVTPVWNNNGTVSIASGGTVGGGNFTNLSSGTVTNLGAINTLLVNQGNVVLGGSVNNFQQTSGTNIISSKGTVTGTATISGGLFDLNGGTYSNGLMVVGGTGVLTSSVANPVFNGGLSNNGTVYLSQGVTFNGAVTNMAAFTWQGTINNAYVQAAGTNLLTGNATITGGVTVNGGLVNLNGNNETTDALNGNGGTINNTGGASTLTIGMNNGGGTYSGTITGAISLVKNGTGTGTLSGNNGYSGNTIINAGTLALGSSTAIPYGAGAGNVVVNGNLNVESQNVSINGLSGSGSINVASAFTSETLTIGNNNASSSFGGIISDSSGYYYDGYDLALVKVGTGTLTLTGANSYNGGTTVSNGVLMVAGNTALGNNYYTPAVTVVSGATLGLSNNIVISNASYPLTLNGAGYNGSGALDSMSGTNTYGGAITLGSAARINSDSGLLTLTSFNSGGNFALTVGGAGNTLISAALPATVNSLTKDGTGVLTLSGANSYSGATTISGGTLKQAGGNEITDVAGAGNVTDNGTLDMGGFNDTIDGLSGSGTVDNSGGGTPTLTVGSGNATSVFAGTIQNSSGTLALTKTGTGVLTLSGTNTYSGATTVAAGVLQAGSSGGLSANSAVSVSSGGTLDLNGQAVTARSVTITSGGGMTNGFAGASLNNGLTNAGTVFVSQNAYFNGPVTNTGAMFFQGAISNGLVNSGSFNLNNNATLTVAPVNKGTINVAASTLTVNPDWSNAGTVQLGGGVLTGGNLTNNSGANVAGFGTVSNQLVNAGIVTATNGNLNLVGAATGAGAYRAVAGTSASTLTFVNGGSISSLFNTGATIQVEGALTNTALFVNEGTIMVAGGTYQSAANLINTNGALMANSGAGTINAAAVFNLGTILATNGTFSVSNLVAQGGTVTIGAGGTLTLPGASSLTNFGTINLQGAAGNNAVLNLGGASLTNKLGGTITGGGIIQNASQVVNLLGGSILATSTGVELQFTNANTFGNAGTIGASAGATLTFGTAGVGSAIISNAGTINLTGGTLNSGNITNLANGFVGGMGTITGPLINIGNLNANGGTLTLVSTPVNNGTAIVASASALNVLTDWTNGGVLTNAATGAVSGGNLTNSGTINGSGFYNSQVVNLNRMNFGGTISNNFLQAAGSFTVLSGGSTVTGSATINGGALDLTGNRLTAGQLVVANTGVLSNSVLGATLNGGVSNAATVNFSTDVYINGTVTNTGFWLQRGAISNSVVNSGTMLVLSNNMAARITGGVVNSGSLTFTNVFVSGPVTNAGSFSMSGAISNNYVQTGGSLTLANTSTITGTANITAGNFDLNGKTYTNGLMVVSGTGVLTSSVANATFNGGLSNAATVYLSQGVTFNGPVTNMAAFSWQGTMNSTYAQGAGTNQLLGNATITGNVSVNGGVIDVNGNAESFGALAGTDGTILNNGGATGTLTIGANNGGGTYLGTLTNGNGVLALVKTGTGTETLNGNNGYSGGTTINGGTLVAGSSTALGSGGLAMTGGTLQLLANLSLANLSGTAGTIGIFSNNLSETLTVGSDNSSTTFSGLISQGGNANTHLALIKNGSGVLTLSGANSYNGGTTIDGGVLSANTLPNTGSTSSSIGTGGLTLNGGTLRYTGGALGTANFSTTVGANGGTLDANSTPYYSGTLSGSGTLNILDSSGGGNAWLFTTGSPGFTGNINIGSGSANSGWLQVRGVTSANQVGTGTVTINGGGTFSYDQGSAATIANPIVLNGGALGAQNVAITYSGPIAISNNSFIGGVQSGSGTTMTLSGVMSGPGGFATAGDNQYTTIILSGTNTYGGNTTINSGTVELNNTLAVQNSTVSNLVANGLIFGTPTTYTLGGLAGAGNIGLGSVALSVGNNNSNTTYSGVLSGSGSLTKIGTGVLTLSGANTYGGATTISGGTLKLGASNVIPDGAGAGNVTDNGTLDMGGFSDTVNGLSGSGTVDNSGVGATTLTVGNNNATSVFAGTIQNTGGALSLTKIGTGDLTLSGNNTFSGVLTVQAGTLTVATVNNAEAAGPLGESANAVVLGGSSTLGTLEYTGTSASTTKPIAIGAAGDNSALGGVIQVDNSGTALTLSGEVYQVNQGLLTKTGAGTLVLAGTQDNVGLGVIVDSGTLVLAKTSNSGVHAIGGAGFTLAGGTVQLGGTGGDQIYDNSVDIIVNSGTFDFNGNSETMGGLTGTGGTILNNGGGASTMTIGFNNDSPTYSGTITDHSTGTGTMALAKIGTGTETLSGSNSYSGGTTISAGTLKLGNAYALGTGGLNMNGGTLNLNLYSISVANLSGNSGTILANSGAFGGTYTLTVGSDNTSTTYGGIIENSTDGYGETVALTKTGGGVLTLSGNNTYSGNTVIQSGGAINIQNANALGSTTAGTTVNSGGALQIQGGITTAAEALTLNGTGLSNGGALENVSGNNTYVGTITLGSATRINSDSGLLTLSSFGSGGNFALTVGGVGNTLISAALPATVNSLTKDGTGVLTLSGANVYVGATTISAGTLKLGANNVLPNGAGAGNVIDNGTLDMAGFTDTINGLSGSGTVDNSGGGTPTLTVGSANATSVFAGTIQNTSGTLALTKTGTGVLTLSGTNTYGGATTVSAGVLQLGSSGGLSSNSVVTVSSGGTLDLNGQAGTARSVTISSGGGLTNGVAGASLNNGLTNAGTVFVSQNAYFNGPVTNTGAMFFQGAISNSLVNSGSFNLNNNATLTVAPANSGTINVAASTLTVNPAWANAGTVQLGGGVLSGGNLANNSGANVAGFGTVSNQLVNAGIVTATNGNLNLVGAATGAGAYRAVAGTSASTLTFVGGGSISSLFNTGATIQVQGALTNTSLFVNEGTIMVAGGTYQSAANLTNAAGELIANSGAGTINAAGVFNLGTILATNATFTISNLVAQGGTVTIGAGGTLTLPGASSLTNFGTINLQGAAGNNAVLNLAGAVLTNKSGGTITGGGVIQNASQVVNLLGGSILATSTVVELQFTNANTFGNAGTIGASAGATLTFGTAGVGSAIITNFGTINLTGGTLNSGNITNLASGFVGGMGTITGPLINIGNVNASGGTLTLAVAPSQLGTVAVASGGTLNVQQAWQNGGLLSMSGGTAIGSTITNASNVSGFGTITPQLVNNVGATVTANGGTLTLTVAPAQLGNLVINNAATLNTLQAWQNSGTINLSGGTAIGSVITNAATVTGFGTITPQMLNNSGATVTASGGALTLTVAPSQLGTLAVANTGTLNVQQAWQNGGLLSMSGGTAIGSTITNASNVSGFGTITPQLVNNVGATVTANGGTLTLTVAPAQLGNLVISNAATLNALLAWQNSGSMSMRGGTVIGAGITNAASIEGFGAINAQVVNNAGATLTADSGLLTLALALMQNGTVIVTNGGTLNVLTAWQNSGTITMLGGVVTNAAITNANFISGYGTINGGGVVNKGSVLAITNGANAGTLTVLLNSATNANGATVGTIGTNAVLNLLTPGGSTLVNNGTISVSGGTILLNNSTGIISNFNTIAGVGNVASLSVVNVGGSSFVAQNPISGLSNLIASLNGNVVTNSGLLGANSGATLQLTVGGGGATDLFNQGRIALNGGFITFNGGQGAVSNISGGIIYGTASTASNLNVANVGGTILASNGTLRVGMLGANSGVMSNFNPASTIVLSNTVLRNTGTIALNGGGLVMGGSTITNDGTIIGPGNYSSGLYNNPDGTVIAQNGTLALATNGATESVQNLGTFSIANASTLDVVPDWVNTNGTVSIAGGGLTGGAVTNVGLVSGFGTISSQLVNMGGGTLTASGAGSLTLVAAPTQNGWVNIANAGTLNVDQAWLNSGTVDLLGGSLVGSIVTNSGTVIGFGTITPQVFNNSGATITANGGTLTLTVAPSQLGSVVISNAATLNTLQAWQNSGTINLSGGTAIGSGITNASAITGFGTITPQMLNNSGATITASGGTLTLTVAPNQLGTLAVANSGTLNVLQAWQNSGLLSMAGGTAMGSTITNAANVSGFGTITPQLVNNGLLVVTNGTLTLSTGPQQKGVIIVADGGGPGTLSVTPAWTNNGTISVATGGTVNGGNLTNLASGTITNFGAINTLLVNQGDVVLGGLVSNFQQTSGTNTVSGAGTVTGTATLTGGVFNLNGGTYSNGLMIVGGTGVLTNSGGVATFNGGLSNAATFYVSAPVFFNGIVTNTGGFFFQGVVVSNNFVNSGAGTVTLNNTATITKTATINGGTFNLNGQTYTNGLMILSGSAVLTNAVAGATFNGGVSNAATVAVTANTFFNGPVTNTGAMLFQGAISNGLVNSGSFNLNNNATVTGTSLNSGTISVAANTLTVNPLWANGGLVQISGGVLAGGAVSNTAGGNISGFGTVSNTVVNASLITATGGTLTMTSAPTTKAGSGISVTASGALNVTPDWANAGTLNIAAGGVVSGGTLTNTGPDLSGSGLIKSFVVNQDYMNWGGTISNNLLQTAGSFTLSGNATITGTTTINGGTLDLEGNVMTNGQLVIGNGAVLQNGGGVAILNGNITNSGTVNFFVSAETEINGFVVNNGTWYQTGIISNNLVNNGTLEWLTWNPGGNTPLITGSISNSGSLALISTDAAQVNGSVTNTGTFALHGTIGGTYLQSAGYFVSSNATINGTATVTGGSFNLAGNTYTGSRMIVSGTGVLTNGVAGATFNSGLSNAATVFVSQNTFFNGTVTNTGTFAFMGAVSNTLVNSGDVILNGSGTISGVLANSGSVNVNNGTLSLVVAPTQTGLIAVNNGATLNAARAWVNNGTITILGGNITGSTVTNAGTMTGFGVVQSVVNNDLIVVTNGTLQATTSFTQNGTVNIATNTQLAVTPTWLNNGTILLNGGFTSGGMMTNGVSSLLAGFGTISNAVVNAGSLVATNGTLNLVNTLTQSGTITVANAATFNSVLNWQNGGFLSMLGGSVIGGQLTNAGSVTGFGTFSPSVINNSGATITASGGGTLTLTAIPFQNGIVNILGTLNVASAWSNGSAGTVSINGGVLTGGTFTVDGTVGGNGTIAANMIVGSAKTVTVSGGTLNVTALTTMNGGAINSGALVNYGTISGDGTIGSMLSNPGYVRATNGLLYVQALSGNQATGTLEASTGGTLQANGVTPWLNNGHVILSGGTVIGGDISNNTSHIISGYGTIAPNVYNSGTVLANNSSQALTLNSSLVNLSGGLVTANAGNLVVGGAFVNQGTLAMANGMGTFAGTVVNSGAWITDPTTNIFQNTYTLTKTGYIQASAGDVYVFTNNGSQVASFVNQSAQSNTFNTVTAKFVFNATLSLTQTMYAAGSNIGNLNVLGGFGDVLVGVAATNELFQYQNNFALGTLEIGSTTEVASAGVDGGVDTGGLQSALFVNQLDLDPGAQLIISNDVQIYFISSNAFTSSQVTLLGDAGLHLLTSDASLVVPEPTVVLLWLSSIATLYAARKRGAGKK